MWYWGAKSTKEQTNQLTSKNTLSDSEGSADSQFIIYNETALTNMIDPENGIIFSVTKSILTEPDNHIFRIGNRIVSRRQYFEHVVSELDEFDTRIEYAYSDLAADITTKTTIDTSMTGVYARIANDLDSEYFRTGFKPFASKASNIRYLREKFPNKLINLDEIWTPQEMISFLEGNDSLAIKVADFLFKNYEKIV